MDIKTTQYLSKSFLDGYYRCRGVGQDDYEISKRANVPEADKAPIPAIVCLAFSVELGLKSIIKAEKSDPPRSHDLHKLFYLLSKESQAKIRQNLSCYSDKFDSLLESMRTAFEDWRYVYEPYDSENKKNKSAGSFSDGFLVELSKAANAVASAYLENSK